MNRVQVDLRNQAVTVKYAEIGASLKAIAKAIDAIGDRIDKVETQRDRKNRGC